MPPPPPPAELPRTSTAAAAPAHAGGEAVLYDARPHPLFIVLRSAWSLALMGALAAVLAWAVRRTDLPLPSGAPWWALGAILLRLGWNLLEWLARRYVLTEQRLRRTGGVLTRYATEMRLEQVQHVSLVRRLRERLFGLGTIGFATAGTGEVEMYWVMVDRPHERLRTVRAAIDARRDEPLRGEPLRGEPPRGEAQRGEASSPGAEGAPAAAALGPEAIPVIGLAGGIGAGKSEVARLFAELGCIVVDSDREARAALDRPEVRDELVRWWGAGVLREDGSVDRRAVANIVFADPAQRERLEALVHPLVRAVRDEVRRRAAAAGAPAVVIDAPLLFEAGIDAECDAVVFVDAPREVRLRRVAEARSWDEAELDRRERSQWPLERKRERSDFVIANDADAAALRARVGEVFRRIVPGRGAGG